MGSPLGDMGNSSTGENQAVNDPQINDGGQNPAWAPFLEKVPAQFHEQVTPVLREWDQNYQRQLNTIKSQYEPYQKYVTDNIPPQHIDTALHMINALEANPRQVIDLISGYYGFNDPQQQNQQQIQQNPQLQQFQQQQQEETDPRYLQFQNTLDQQAKQIEIMSQILIQRNQQEQQAQEDARLDSEMKALHAKYTKEKGVDFNDKIVMGMAMGGNLSPEQAVQAYYAEMEKLYGQMQMPRPAPNIMGSGGGMPSGAVNTRNMAQTDLDRFAVQYLQQANINGQ